ncbi:hypothetical protein CHARACLAT_018893 [Characodon lateralis]|uniref:Uncharacterized protein n=1 Tax=Characodon lateralis TaxID=208331 RepID=A0ABU7DC99_9TELE|nr:hypothetical protein [Characodon lateralis]
MASSPPTCRKATLFTASDFSSIPLATSKVQISEPRFRRRKFTNLKMMKRQLVSSQELTRGTFYSENISEYIFIQIPKESQPSVPTGCFLYRYKTLVCIASS